MECRVCQSATIPWLNLGTQPLANGFYSPHEKPPPKYPLQVLRCPKCGLSQLSVVVPPASLYENYSYRSEVSTGFQRHCRDIGALASNWNKSKGRWLDIASNDGTLINHVGYFGFEAQGVEPAKNLAAYANSQGRSTTVGFFPAATKNFDAGQFAVISSVNVLGHVADVHAFAAEVERLLAPDGSWVVEVPWVRELLDKGEFDTIYHEHLSYWSLRALDTLARAHGMCVSFAEFHPIHGGSLLVRIRRGTPNFTMWDESRLFSQQTYYDFQRKMQARLSTFVEKYNALRGKWAGFGAAAKGTVFACAAGINENHLRFVVDETPEKQGKLTPYGVPIVGLNEDTFLGITNLLVFPWNHLEEIKAKLPPRLRVVSA